MKNYLKKTLLFAAALMFSINLIAQKNNIPLSDIPSDVKEVLAQYIDILSKSKTVEDAAAGLFKAGLIGGGLLNSTGTGASDDILRFSLKKDFDNVKFYENPPVITGVTFTADTYDGFQNTLIQGDIYKIWIKKKEGVNGLPAPIPVMKPKTGTPKIVSVIGSL